MKFRLKSGEKWAIWRAFSAFLMTANLASGELLPWVPTFLGGAEAHLSLRLGSAGETWTHGDTHVSVVFRVAPGSFITGKYLSPLFVAVFRGAIALRLLHHPRASARPLLLRGGEPSGGSNGRVVPAEGERIPKPSS